jgi:hypothetical protein
LDGAFSFSRVVELLRAEPQKAGAATRKLRAHCTSSKKSYVSVTDSMTFSSLSLSRSLATNLIG